jgi:NAD+ synthase
MAASETAVGVDLRLDEASLHEVRDLIVVFVSDIVDDAGADGAVIGLSGGIDSTLTAYLAVEALGPDAVHGLVMPSSANESDNMSDAERVAEEIGIAYDVIDIEPIVDGITDAYPAGADDRSAAGNVRVRTRAVLSYFVANTESRIVLGTGNRSEALVGYYTKYGDQAVDCNPIGGLYKTQVRQLARHLGVPDRIVEKPPTAGMWSGQTDEDELGVDYETLDAVLALHIDGGVPEAGTASIVGVDPDTVRHVRDLHERSAHKRRRPPSPDLPG